MWRFGNIPAQLRSTFVPGTWGVATQGAVMAFEAEHNLKIDGAAGPAFWTALLEAVAARQTTARPYDYLIVTETEPETLYVWREGKVVLETPINTGVQGASTALGTWPVYLRFTSTTMTGTNPDGTHYSDPGVPWVSYFHGSDAVHGFWRDSFGYPQSDGCVEVPISTAAQVYPLDPYGTLVTVTTGNLSAAHAAGPSFALPTRCRRRPPRPRREHRRPTTTTTTTTRTSARTPTTTPALTTVLPTTTVAGIRPPRRERPSAPGTTAWCRERPEPTDDDHTGKHDHDRLSHRGLDRHPGGTPPTVQQRVRLTPACRRTRRRRWRPDRSW